MKEEILQDIQEMSNIMDKDIITRKLNKNLNIDNTYPKPRIEKNKKHRNRQYTQQNTQMNNT